MNHLHALHAIYDPREARAIYLLVMEKVFGLSQTAVLLGKDSELSVDSHRELNNIIARLVQGEPVQYVLGEADFCGRTFHVEPGVLIPRPETEQLVRLVLEQASPARRILDIGTGSGCIAITLAKAGHQVTAFDVSEEALSIAARNAESLEADVHFVHEDILHPAATDMQWDIIVSNPPYVRQSEKEGMAAHVLEHEPALALFVPDSDPLRFYRAIGLYATQHLAPGGALYLEVNQALATDTARLLGTLGLTHTCVHPDQFGHPRFVTATLHHDT